MSSSAMTPALSQPVGIRPAGTNWIISRRDDLVWFIGPAAISYLALGLMVAGFPITPIYLTWFLFVDGPHVMGTITRTYLDKQERKRLGWFMWVIVPLVLIGPLMVWAGQSSLFYLFAVCWQHYHIAKQHMGFMMLWKAKNKERDPLDLKLDRWFMLSSTVLPLALFVIKTRMMNVAPAQWLGGFATAAYAIFAALYVGRQVKKFRAGVPLNVPKLMLLAVLVPLQWIAFLYAASFGAEGILRAGITLGLFHSLQYHRLLWFHNKNRYSTPQASEQYGLAAYFARDLGYYILVALGLHFALNVLPQAYFPAVLWLQAAIWGIPFTHYMLDSKIWRVRGDKELAAALRM
ncbi:MAG TPA: hypothetical protein VK686_05690 [Bryobacteraceae bacterium]|nr:hypothetical protein [Bryobacteraceae bacterium]